MWPGKPLGQVSRPELKHHRSKFRSESGRKAFQEWYHGIHQQSRTAYDLLDIDTCYGNTRVAVGGKSDGPPVLFLHGWSGNGMMWEITGSLQSLAGDYRIYLVDVIGQPNNSSPLSPPVRGLGYGIWLSELLDKLGVDSCAIVGMSFGGFLIVKMAQVAPERIRKAIFMGPAGFTGLHIRPRMVSAFSRAILRPSRLNIKHFVQSNILGSSDRFTPDQLDKIVDMFHITFRHFSPGAQFPYLFPSRELQAVRNPSILLCGEQDALFDAERLRKRAEGHLPGLIRAEILPGLGHALGNSDQVVKRIDHFLRETP